MPLKDREPKKNKTKTSIRLVDKKLPSENTKKYDQEELEEMIIRNNLNQEMNGVASNTI